MLIERDKSYSSALSCWLGGEQCGRGWELSWVPGSRGMSQHAKGTETAQEG